MKTHCQKFCEITVICAFSRKEEGLSLLTAPTKSHVFSLKVVYTLAIVNRSRNLQRTTEPVYHGHPFGTGQIAFWKKLASAWTTERAKMSMHLIFTWLVRWEESQPICLNTLVLPSWHPSQLLVAPPPSFSIQNIIEHVHHCNGEFCCK